MIPATSIPETGKLNDLSKTSATATFMTYLFIKQGPISKLIDAFISVKYRDAIKRTKMFFSFSLFF